MNPSRNQLFACMALLIAMCAGILLCTGAIVAPVVFMTLLPDHVTAGRLAAKVFEISYWITSVVALLLVLLRLPRARFEWALALSLLALVAVQLLWVTPALLHQGQGWPFSFAALHGTASVMHALLFVAALILAWKLKA